MKQELESIRERLISLIGKNSHEVILLNVRLSCRNCKNADYPDKEWICKLYGEIPKEFLDKGCNSWVNNIYIK